MGILFFLIMAALMMVGVFVVGIILLIRFLFNNSSRTSSTGNLPANPDCTPMPPSGFSEGGSEHGIMRVRFDTSKSGLMTTAREQAMLEASEQAAGEWLTNNPDVEVISIASTMGGMNASVTVWYKQADNGNT